MPGTGPKLGIMVAWILSFGDALWYTDIPLLMVPRYNHANPSATKGLWVDCCCSFFLTICGLYGTCHVVDGHLRKRSPGLDFLNDILRKRKIEKLSCCRCHQKSIHVFDHLLPNQRWCSPKLDSCFKKRFKTMATSVALTAIAHCKLYNSPWLVYFRCLDWTRKAVRLKTIDAEC